MHYPSFYAMRHGETKWNGEGRFQGHSDVPLSPTGRLHAAKNGKRLKIHLDRMGVSPASLSCISSPLLRARQTMRIVQGELGISGRQVNTDPRLREASFGRWEGLTSDEVKARFPEERRRRKKERWTFAPEGGGSFAALDQAMREVLAALPPDGRCLIVTHSGNLKVMLGLLLGLAREETMAAAVPHDAVLAWDGGTLAWI